MSDNKKDDAIIGVRLTLEECPTGGPPHITDIEPIYQHDVVYDAGKATVGWNPLYASKWEENFGKKTEVVDEDLN